MQFQERFINVLIKADFELDDIQYLLDNLNPEVLENGDLFTDDMILERAKLEINLWRPMYEALANYIVALENCIRLGI